MTACGPAVKLGGMQIFYRQDSGTTHFRVFSLDRGSIYQGDGVLGRPARWFGGPPQPGADPQAVLSALTQRARDDGYDALPQHVLMIQYALDSSGSAEDQERRNTVTSLLTNALASLGYGTVDGEDIGSGKMTVFAFVVQPAAAASCCVGALREAGLLAGVVLVSAPPDDDGDQVAHWPEGYDVTAFSVL